jgi:hypothetical protein
MKLLAGLVSASLALGAVGSALAQHLGHRSDVHGKGEQPYAGLQSRSIASLSEEEIAALHTGRGMGFAIAAELNGYPGPMHVLELAAKLALTADQQTRVQAIFDAMRRRAIAAGKEYIAAEAALDALYRSGTATEQTTAAPIQEAGIKLAGLRQAHLDAHLETARLLSAAQRAKYAELRGYVGSGSTPPHKGSPHHHRGHQ